MHKKRAPNKHTPIKHTQGSKKSLEHTQSPASKTIRGKTDTATKSGHLNMSPSRDPKNWKEQILIKLHKETMLEETSPQYPNIKIFGTNCPYDFLLFVTEGSSVKIMNILSGKTISIMQSAHFKGTNNFGIIMDEGPTSKLNETLRLIGEKVIKGSWKPQKRTQNATPNKPKHDQSESMSINESDGFDIEDEGNDYHGPDLLQDLFVDQLSGYLLCTSSSKDKLKIWKFENGENKLCTSENSIGGNGGTIFDFMVTKDKELVIISSGNQSNKVELFKL